MIKDEGRKRLGKVVVQVLGREKVLKTTKKMKIRRKTAVLVQREA